MPVKTIKLQVVKPKNEDWKILGNLFFELQKETRFILNKTIQLCWEYQCFSSEYKEKHGTYPKNQEILDYKSVDGFIYNQLKSSIHHMNTTNLNASIQRGVKKWKSDVKEILKGDRSIPNFKKDLPIDVAKANIKGITKEQNDFIVSLSLINKAYFKELDRKNGIFDIVVSANDQSTKAILNRLISGDYHWSTSQIVKAKNKYFLNLTYQFQETKKELKDENIMGIDLGIVYPVYIAFNNNLHRYHIKGGEVDRFRKQVEKRKKELLNQGMYTSREGRGTKNRIEPIEKLNEKISNFRNTKNHIYSDFVIKKALYHQCKIIQMEDLTGISKDDVFLKNWSYYDLQLKIEYKAKQNGIKVIKIKPDYTSQRCNRCGCIDKGNREDQETFICKTCDLKVNADYNASKNIATKDIEKIIEEQLKLQNKSVKQLSLIAE